MCWITGNDSNLGDYYTSCSSILGPILPWKLTVYLFLDIIAGISNVLLLFAIYKDPLKCFLNPTTYFIVNLGIVDFINALLHLEEMLVSQTKYKSTFCLPGVWELIHTVAGRFIYVITYPSVTVLALERYISIAYPLWHQVNVTSRVCKTWIALVWFINSIYIGLFTPLSFKFDIDVSRAETVYPAVFYLATVFIYLLAFTAIRKQTFTLSADTTKSESARRMMNLRSKNQNRFLTTIFIINIVLTFGFMPMVIGMHFVCKSREIFSALTTVMSGLFLLSMAANPFLYIWRLPKYRKTFLVMYNCKK